MSLSPDARWKRVEELFARASALPAAERDALLDRECGDDATLRADVESLLRAGDRADDFIGGAISGARHPPERVPIGAGSRIGPYEILRELGVGGMGAVYLAERADRQYHSTVAIKLARDVASSAEMLRRFRAERQILANLDHPNIAKLLDGGATDWGQPYVVMEFVEGAPIDRYADARRLGISERIRLLLHVAAAVEHANRNLVVHRDLKPSNILVTAAGVPKLLDFGIAKLLGPIDDLDAPVTRTAMRLLTPAYASPEQVRGDPVSTASDVYSLGVVAYELLVGTLPYPSGRARAEDFTRIVLEEEPVRPSVMAQTGSGGDGPSREAALRRNSSPERLRRRLAGDLDVILLTALRKEPARRYPTVAAFAEDLRRHLEGLPVRARSDTLRYRAAKFVRRNRLAVATAGTALIVALAMIAFYTTRLTAERDRALAEAAKADQVAGFLTDAFALANPEATGGAALTAREMLARGAERIARLESQPEIQAALLATIGSAYIKIGQADSARPLLERALELQRRTIGSAHPDVAETLLHLGELQYEAGSFDSALALISRAVEIQATAPSTPILQRALGLNNLGWLTYERGNFPAADSLHRAALALRLQAAGPMSEGVAESRSNLASVRHAIGDLDGADSLYRSAIAIRREVLGPGNPLLAFTYNNLAALLEERRELAAAESLFRVALRIEEAAYGTGSPRQSTNYVNLGRVLGRMGRNDEAEQMLRTALRLDRLRGVDHPYVAYDLRTLGDFLRGIGKADTAERYYQEALAIYRAMDPPDGINTGSVLRGLALLRLDAGDAAGAEPLVAEAAETWGALLPGDHVDLNHLRTLLAEAYAGLGRRAEAESLLAAGRAVLIAKLKPDDPRIVRSARLLERLRR